MTKVDVKVFLKKEVLDPEARAASELARKEFGSELKKMTIAKCFSLEFEGLDGAKAHERAEAMAKAIFCNPVSHEFEISIKEA